MLRQHLLFGVLLQKRAVPTGYLEAQSRKRTRGFSDPKPAAGLPRDLAVGQGLFQFEVARAGNLGIVETEPLQVGQLF